MRDITVEFAQWRAPDNIRAFTTNRTGGVSLAPYESLNLGSHVGDLEQSVQENRDRLVAEQRLPEEPSWLNQVHGNRLIELLKSDEQASPVAADGAWTRQSGVVCAVLTADCLPLLLTNKRGDRVAAIHAGWRGMANGIIEQGILALDDHPSNIIAWAGPCIGAAAFEIGLEVREQLGGSDSAYHSTGSPDKVMANLYQLTGERLAGLGVENYSHSRSCSYRDDTKFFSYRRDGECGRMATVVWMQR